MSRLLTVAAITAASALLPAALTTAAHAQPPADHFDQSELAAVRAATVRFKDVDTAKAAGYAELADAQQITCIDNPAGAMGIHYVNIGLVLDPTLDPTQPEALVYEPEKNGRLRLVAVEYVVFEASLPTGTQPALLGQDLERLNGQDEAHPNRYGLPAFYELHAWVWKQNPSGMFADWNPKVSC